MSIEFGRELASGSPADHRVQALRAAGDEKKVRKQAWYFGLVRRMCSGMHNVKEKCLVSIVTISIAVPCLA